MTFNVGKATSVFHHEHFSVWSSNQLRGKQIGKMGGKQSENNFCS